VASVRENDLVQIRAQLAAWLERSLGVSSLHLSELEAPATGAVNDTFLYTLTWEDESGRQTQRQVLRRQPDGYSNLRDNDVLAQARFLQKLGVVPDLPVPAVRWVEEDPDPLGGPFYIMDAIPGQIGADQPPYPIRGWLCEATPSQRRSVYRQAIEAMAKVHEVDWQSIGLGYLDERSPSETPLACQLRKFREFMLWGAEGERYGTLESGYEWLAEHFPTADGPTVLNWNDARLGNMMFDGFILTGLLDWELVSVGPPEVDLAWFLWHDRFMAERLGAMATGKPMTQLEGAPDLTEGAKWYEEFSGYQPSDMRWYETFAAFRLAVYLMRHGKGMILKNLAPRDSRVDHVNSASLELAAMLGLPAPGEPSGLL
jgi:aminoglycoside phosphotransferase (APT) family kinase protein